MSRQLKLQSAQAVADQSESLELVKLNAEKDTNTLLNVKFKLEKEVAELQMKLMQKEEEREKREQLLVRKFQKEMAQVSEDFETSIESMQAELDRAKYANMALENNMHELRLEMEKSNKMISSSFYHLGLIQVQKSSNDSTRSSQPDWLDS